MTDNNYLDIYDMWRRKAIDQGIKLNDFRNQYYQFVEVNNRCMMTAAIGAKLTYTTLIKNKKDELDKVNKEVSRIKFL
jgi:hypothetical protein